MEDIVNKTLQLVEILRNKIDKVSTKPSIESLKAFVSASNLMTADNNLRFISYSPIEEGGMSFDFYRGDNYIWVQFDNENQASIYFEPKQVTPQGWELTYSEALIKLKELINTY